MRSAPAGTRREARVRPPCGARPGRAHRPTPTRRPRWAAQRRAAVVPPQRSAWLRRANRPVRRARPGPQRPSGAGPPRPAPVDRLAGVLRAGPAWGLPPAVNRRRTSTASSSCPRCMNWPATSRSTSWSSVAAARCRRALAASPPCPGAPAHWAAAVSRTRRRRPRPSASRPRLLRGVQDRRRIRCRRRRAVRRAAAWPTRGRSRPRVDSVHSAPLVDLDQQVDPVLQGIRGDLVDNGRA